MHPAEAEPAPVGPLGVCLHLQKVLPPPPYPIKICQKSAIVSGHVLFCWCHAMSLSCSSLATLVMVKTVTAIITWKIWLSRRNFGVKKGGLTLLSSCMFQMSRSNRVQHFQQVLYQSHHIYRDGDQPKMMMMINLMLMIIISSSSMIHWWWWWWCSGVVCPSTGCPGFLLPSRALLWSCYTCQNQVWSSFLRILFPEF